MSENFARLYEETRERAEHLAALLQIAQDLSNAMTDPQHLLNQPLERAVDLFGVTRAAIVYYENDAGRVLAACNRSGANTGSEPLTHLPHSPLQEKLRAAAETVAIYDVLTDPLLSEEERSRLVRAGVRSTLLLPLIARGRVIGTLGLDETRYNRAFSAPELEMGQLLAGIAAPAIDNATIYGLAEHELSAVLRVAQNLASAALNPAARLDAFLQYVMDQTLSLLNFDAGWLLLREGELVRIVATDDDHAADRGRCFAMRDSVSGLSMLRQDVISIPDLAHMAEEYRRVYKAPAGARQMQSELVAPLIVGDQAIGAFNVESDARGAFEGRHTEMLKLLGGHAALAIELVRSREEGAALSATGLELARDPQVQVVVEKALKRALALTQAKFGQIVLREGARLRVKYTTNHPPEDFDMPVDIQDSVSGLAVQLWKPVIVPDVTRPVYLVAERLEPPVWPYYRLERRTADRVRYKRALEREKEHIQAEYAVPIMVGAAVIGVVNVETPRDDGFTRQQREDLLAYVSAVAAQFEDAFAQSDIAALKRLLVGAMLPAGTDFGQVLRLVGELLIIEQTTGAELLGTAVNVRESVVGYVIEDPAHAPKYVADVTQEPRYKRYLGAEMKSELAVPLIVGDKVIGVLNMESEAPAYFTVDDVRKLEPFASHVAVAIDRAKTVEAMTFAEIGAQAGDIVHRLNNPIGAMGFRLEMLKRQPFYPALLQTYPYLGAFLEKTAFDLSRTKEIIRELRSSLKPAPAQPTDLAAAIHTGLQRAGLPDAIQPEILLPNEMISVMANQRLANVFWNLFDNARKAMPAGGTLRVTAQISADQKWVTVRVGDTGRGIEPWRLDTIFDPDEYTSPDRHEPAHGLGLWWVAAQVQKFGGPRPRAESNLGQGTTITLELPMAADLAPGTMPDEDGR